MRKQSTLLSILIIMVAMVIGFSSCNKKEDKVTFALTALTANGINLNGATPPTNIPSLPEIKAYFSLDVNAASFNVNQITLIRTYDLASIPLTVTVGGTIITVLPNEDLGNGAQYTLTYPAIGSTDGQSIAGFQRTFTTEGTFVPSGVLAHWNFEGNTNDVVGTWNASAAVDITYAASYKAAAGTAGAFNGTTTIVEIPNGDQLTNTADFTISFWVYANSVGHVNASGDPKGHFVFGLGAFKGFQFEITGDYASCKLAASYELADGTTASEDLWFNGDGKTGQNGGWQGWTFCKDLTASGGVAALLKDKWANIVCVYDGTTKIGTMYINGEKMKAQDFNLWPDGDVKQGIKGLKWGGVPPEVYPTLALGFIQSREGTMWANEPWGGYIFPTANHFGGYLDDIRIFHKPLTATEVSLMYDSEKP